MDQKKKREKKYIYTNIFHSSQKTTSCIGLKRVRRINCFYTPSNVVSTALNEYTVNCLDLLFGFYSRYPLRLFILQCVRTSNRYFHHIRADKFLFDVTLRFPARKKKREIFKKKNEIKKKRKTCRIEKNVNVRYFELRYCSIIEAVGYSSRFFFSFFFSCSGKFDIQIHVTRGSRRTLLKRQFIILETYMYRTI